MNHSISRRAALRGIGATLALPLFESNIGLTATARSGNTSLPRRMAFLMVPNGVHLPDWTPPGEGYMTSLPHILQPLRKVKRDVLVLSGLTHDKGRDNGDGPGDHARACATFLTASQPYKNSGTKIHVGISVDQVAAGIIGRQTRFGSLELGCEESILAGDGDSGYGGVYSSNIAWRSPTTPVAKETNPRLVFERLFPNHLLRAEKDTLARKRRRTLSILDTVLADAQRLQHTLGAQDRRTLDEYLTSVREVERRVVASDTTMLDDPSPGNATEIEKPLGVPDTYQDHLRLMCDMLVLAFQTDATRIATMMFANEGSNRSYRCIDVPEGHHHLSHHGGDSEKLEKIRKINRFHVQQFAYFLERLKSIREADGSSLLDHSMIVYGSGISDGDRHNNENLPLLLAGRGGGTIRSGRHVRYETETPMANLFLSMLDRVGVVIDDLGDSTDRLHDLV